MQRRGESVCRRGRARRAGAVLSGRKAKRAGVGHPGLPFYALRPRADARVELAAPGRDPGRRCRGRGGRRGQLAPGFWTDPCRTPMGAPVLFSNIDAR